MNGFLSANAVLSMFSKNYMELKKGLPIRPSEMGVLNIITETPGPHTPVALAGLLGVSKPMITAHITALSQKGYVVRQQSQEDKRVYYVLPTDKALALVKDAGAQLDQRLNQLVEGLGQEEFDHLVSLARQANAVLETKREEAQSPS